MMMHGFGFLAMLVPFVFCGAIVYFVIRAVRSDRRPIKNSKESTPGTAIEQTTSTERQIYQLARKNGGRVTVSDLVADVGVSAAQAETQLQSMTDESRVRMEVSEDGVVSYTFPEFSQDK